MNTGILGHLTEAAAVQAEVHQAGGNRAVGEHGTADRKV